MQLFGRIGRRLLIWSLLASLAPIVILGFLAYRQTRAAIVRGVFLHMQSVAGLKRAEVEGWLSERMADMSQAAADTRLTGAEANEALREYLAGDNGYEHIGVFNAAGVAVNVTGRSAIGDWANRMPEIIRGCKPGNLPCLSQVGYNPELGTEFTIIAALSNPSGEARFIAAEMALSRSLDPMLLDSAGLGSSGQTYLVGADHIMLTRSRFMSHPAPGTHRMFSDGIDHALTGATGAGLYAGWEGKMVLGAWSNIEPTGCALVAEMNEDEALAGVERLKRDWLVVGILTAIGVVILVAVMARAISRPLLQLAAGSRSVSSGDLTVRTGIHRSDEIGDLGAAFDGMTAALEESRRSLEASYRDLVAAERRLAQSEKLAAIGQLVASVVHELRNPLSAIKMNLRILTRKLSTGNSASGDTALEEHLQIAEEQAFRLERMLTELLDYSKPVVVDLRPVSMKSVIEASLALLNNDIGKRGIAVQTSIAEDLPQLIGDAQMLEQAMVNLIRNSIEAMGSGGKLQIRAGRDVMDKEMVQVEIEDNGPGIAANQVERIFEPFFTTKPDGTGLGLSNVRKVVELHQGRIEMRSEPGRGTLVIIYLPLEVANG